MCYVQFWLFWQCVLSFCDTKYLEDDESKLCECDKLHCFANLGSALTRTATRVGCKVGVSKDHHRGGRGGAKGEGLGGRGERRREVEEIERLARNTWAMEEDGAENGELLSLRDNEDVGGSAGGEGNGGGGGGPSVGYGGAELDMTVATIQTKTEEKRRDSKNSTQQLCMQCCLCLLLFVCECEVVAAGVPPCQASGETADLNQLISAQIDDDGSVERPFELRSLTRTQDFFPSLISSLDDCQCFPLGQASVETSSSSLSDRV
ncbi:hypothetical protein RRG08_007628 [Elysia crispata]|uniref:Uncharacterized protein n=1 Tax=Elysia crispata TaxID=231223 RepID=A0AAE1BCS5_9GAST|nr:hypothetical protein RRG08_007628 [Elysia crispata]